MTNIAVVGVGGVGGYFGGLLAKRYEDDPDLAVHFIARGAHLEAIRAKGLSVDAEGGRFVCRPRTAGDSISALPALDFCLVCVKGYDLVGALAQLKPKVGPKTVLLPLMNGVDVFERTRSVLESGYLHPACVYVSSRIEAPGAVVQRGKVASIYLGPDPGREAEDRSILPYLEAAGVGHQWTSFVFTEIWLKYMFIAPFSLVTAASGKTLGEVLASEKELALAKALMGEVKALADAAKVALPETVIEDTLVRAGRFPADTRTSFQRDFAVAGKPDERDFFAGSVLRMGRRYGIGTPTTEAVLAELEERKPS